MDMPAENIDKMSEQKEFLISNVHLNPESKVNAAQDKSSNMPNEEASFSFILSNIESTNRSKRPLVDKLSRRQKIKKFLLSEAIDYELTEDNSFIDSNINDIDPIDSTIQKIDEMLMELKNKNISNAYIKEETQEEYNINDTITNNVVDNDNNASSNDSGIDKKKEVNLDRKKYICKEVNKNYKSTNNTEDVFRTIVNDYSNTETSLSKMSLELNNESSSAAIIKNTDHENDEIIQSPESIVIENEVEMMEIDPVSKKKVLDTTKDITDNNGNDHRNDNNNHKNVKIIVSDSNSDVSDVDELCDDELVNDIINGVKNLNKNDFLWFINMFVSSNMLFDQLDNVCSQKMIGVLPEKGDLGYIRNKIKLLEKREKLWRGKYTVISKQLKDFKSVFKMHEKQLRTDKYAKPRKIERTVGLQAFVPQKTRVSKIPNSSKEPNHVQLPNAAAQESSTITPSSAGIKRSTVNKVGPSSSSLGIVNTDINCTIDLTEENDIIDVTDRLKTKHPRNKIVKNSTINTHTSAGTTSQLKYLTTQVNLSAVEFIDLSTLPQTASSYMVNTSSSTRLSQLMTIPINPPQPVNPFLLRDGQALPIQIVNSASSTVNSAPSVVYSTSSVVPASQVPVALRRLARSLPPVPPAIPIHPADLPTIPKQKSLSGWKKLPPAPILSQSVSTENSKALILSWNMNLSSLIADITTYQIYAYHEVATEFPRQELWRNIGEVNALPLPMACSLIQLLSGENYHFAVRAVDIHARVGPFSQILSIYNSN